jgi:hypothetical protein
MPVRSPVLPKPDVWLCYVWRLLFKIEPVAFMAVSLF